MTPETMFELIQCAEYLKKNPVQYPVCVVTVGTQSSNNEYILSLN